MSTERYAVVSSSASKSLGIINFLGLDDYRNGYALSFSCSTAGLIIHKAMVVLPVSLTEEEQDRVNEFISCLKTRFPNGCNSSNLLIV